MKPRQDFDLCVINVVERVRRCAFYREEKNRFQTNIQKKIRNYRVDCREHMGRLHFTFMQSLATQFPEFQSFAKRISPNFLSIWHSMFLKQVVEISNMHLYVNFKKKIIGLVFTLQLCGWNFENYQHQFDHIIATTQATKNCKTLNLNSTLKFDQHCDSWDWNLENFENSFDLVDVELFWLLSANDFFSWSTSLSRVLFRLYIWT